MKRLLFTILLLSTVISATISASDIGEQVLIFRHNGEVNIFNSSNLKSIENTFSDADNGISEPILVQRFITPDTIMEIPVAEIDSVTFGSRNGIIPKPNVWHIAASHLPYITSFDGKEIVYSSSAPAEIIPGENIKIYCDEFCEQFPFGFCGRSVSVKTENGTRTVTVESMPPEDVFEYFFYADESPDPIAIQASPFKASDFSPEFNETLEAEGITIGAGAQLDIKLSNLVFAPLRHYYHTTASLKLSIGIDIQVEADESAKAEMSSPSLTIARIVTGPLMTRLNASLFFDVEASLKLKMQLLFANGIVCDWTRMNGQNNFNFSDNHSPDDYSDPKLPFEAILKGEIFSGLMTRLIFSPIFDVAGAYVQNKTGLKFTGELGFESLDLFSRQPIPPVAPDFKLTGALSSRFDSYTYIYNMATGENQTHPLPFSADITLAEMEFDLMPFLGSRASTCQMPSEPGVPSKPGNNGVEAASITATPILAPLSMGYDIVSDNGEEIFATIEDADTILPLSRDVQGIKGSVPVQSRDVDNLKVRPFVNYADRKIPYPLCNISHGAKLFPYYASLTGSGSYLVAGAPIIGQTADDGTIKIIGNYMPVSKVEECFKDKDKHRSESLIEIGSIPGQWSGDGIYITFNDDGTVNYTGKPGTYLTNYPQAGMVSLFFYDGSTLAITVISLTNSTLTITFPPYNKTYILKK